jgi:signal peptidase I
VSETRQTRNAAGESTAEPPKSVVREYAETIVVCVLILLFARCFVFVQSKIPTGSMLETLQIGDYILVNRYLYGAPDDLGTGWLGQRDIERGDVIVFRYPEDPDVDYVKRVVGLPGETVEMIDGEVWIDGEPLVEPYVEPGNRDPIDFGPTTVRAGHYFCMGDNRDNSRDSRVWGPVPRSLVRGRAFLIWFSYEEDRGDHLRTGLERLVSIAEKIPRLPWRTRWGRIFSLIDGEHAERKDE